MRSLSRTPVAGMIAADKSQHQNEMTPPEFGGVISFSTDCVFWLTNQDVVGEGRSDTDVHAETWL